jgi:hypothetical protein
MFPFDEIGDGIGSLIADAFDSAMTAIWSASLDLLRAAFTLADRFSIFTVSTTNGPIGVVWPMMLWISGAVALTLFFWQLTTTNLRAGRGFVRLVGGPVQYGVSLAATVGMVAAFLAAVDGITDGILKYGLQAKNFGDAFSHTTFADAASHGVKAAVLGLCAIVGVLPAAVGYVLEMLFREAAVDVLVAVVPIAAAGLLANVTASWFWRTSRWLLVAIAMKAVLALTLVLGVAIAGGSQGLAGVLAGVGVLVISLIAPFTLFRLFAFIDPNSDAGGAFRDFLSGIGMGSYGENSLVSSLANLASAESTNVDRFDDALASTSESDQLDQSHQQDTDARPDSHAGRDGEGGDDPPAPDAPGGDGGDRHPDDDGGGGSPAPQPDEAAAVEAAGEVIL